MEQFGPQDVQKLDLKVSPERSLLWSGKAILFSSSTDKRNRKKQAMLGCPCCPESSIDKLVCRLSVKVKQQNKKAKENQSAPVDLT